MALISGRRDLMSIKIPDVETPGLFIKKECTLNLLKIISPQSRYPILYRQEPLSKGWM
jgi:hypothetical protein